MGSVIGVSGNGWCMLRRIGLSSSYYKQNSTSWNSKGKRNSACMALCEINVQKSNSNLPNCNCPIDNKRRGKVGHSGSEQEKVTVKATAHCAPGPCSPWEPTGPVHPHAWSWQAALQRNHIVCEALLDQFNFSHKEQELVGKTLNADGMADSWLGLSWEAAWTCALWMVLHKVGYCTMRRTYHISQAIAQCGVRTMDGQTNIDSPGP